MNYVIVYVRNGVEHRTMCTSGANTVLQYAYMRESQGCTVTDIIELDY